MKQEVLTAVKGMNFWSYLARNVPAHYSWGTKISLDDIMSWSKTMDEPILRLPKSQYQLAVTIFRCICRVCGDEDEPATFKQREKSRMLLIKVGMEKSQRIRDEIILQLVKQIRKNKGKLSTESAFSLLGCVVSTILPSEELIYPLMNWLVSMIDLHTNDAYRDWSRYILSRVYHSHLAEDKRFFTPDPLEVAYVTNRKKVKIPLYMGNGTFLTMWIESYTDFEELKAAALQRLGLKTSHHWRYGFVEYIEYEEKFGSVEIM